MIQSKSMINPQKKKMLRKYLTKWFNELELNDGDGFYIYIQQKIDSILLFAKRTALIEKMK